MPQKRFILSDERIKNSYGFYVATAGIKLARFNENPVMLSGHRNDNDSVLGRWLDPLVDGPTLSAEPQFDMDDEAAAKIAGKVEREFIKGASIGLLFGPDDLIYLDGKIIMKECELIEASIIPVPSNANCLQLYLRTDDGQKLLSKDDIQSMCLAVEQPLENLNPANIMKKIILSLAAYLALGFKDAPKDGVEESEVETRILGLSVKLETAEKRVVQLEAENTTLKTADEAAKATAGKAFLKAAVDQGRIKADEVEAYLGLYNTNPELTMRTVGALPGKTNLSAQTPPGGTTQTPGEVTTREDFMKLSHPAQLAFKAENPDEYKKLFN